MSGILKRKRDRKGMRPKLTAQENYVRNRARTMAHQAFLKGNIIRPNGCQRCGQDEKLSMHHGDYSKPLSVEWLCSPCHRKADREVTPRPWRRKRKYHRYLMVPVTTQVYKQLTTIKEDGWLSRAQLIRMAIYDFLDKHRERVKQERKLAA